jgi:putative cell wall-binding protein
LTEPLSEKAKEKLRKLSENQKKHLEQMKKDFEEGKYDDIISQLKKEFVALHVTFRVFAFGGALNHRS